MQEHNRQTLDDLGLPDDLLPCIVTLNDNTKIECVCERIEPNQEYGEFDRIIVYDMDLTLIPYDDYRHVFIL